MQFCYFARLNLISRFVIHTLISRHLFFSQQKVRSTVLQVTLFVLHHAKSHEGHEEGQEGRGTSAKSHEGYEVKRLVRKDQQSYIESH